ncbi:SGNH/GDSL hydrolase family protein [Psychrobacillus antarcticus]|uniref:SGNH/GDSL hydrolase family protein n=1 Tax=Psychrobacillus antarcticus TaxID=2879115 RepID=UPI002407FE7E|nr:GDSL-type esterase/lipase family protein [Psychrobacillus antarcticus]
MRKICTVILVATITIFSFFSPSVYAENLKIDYVALGDSLASGHTPYGVAVSRGFTDIISEVLAEEEVLGSFTKEFASSGQTSAGLLETLKSTDVKNSLENAELVTIISGANDFIDEFYNPLDGSVNVDLPKATALLEKVAGNLTSAIKQVKALNPEADVYLYGYYFPLPHIQDVALRQKVQIAFNIANDRLATLVKQEGAHFVEVATIFDKNGAAYLENPVDIHPNAAGYEVLAAQFFANYSIPVNKTLPTIPEKWGQIIEKSEPVSSDKTWTISLSKSVDPKSVDNAIYVVKDGTVLMPVSIKVSSTNSKQILVSAPKQGYKPGNYQLMVTNDLTDTLSGPLKTTVLVKFQIK